MLNELFVVNFIFIRCFWKQAGAHLCACWYITGAVAAATYGVFKWAVCTVHTTYDTVLIYRASDRCGCHRTHKSELNFIQLSLPVERVRHSGVLYKVQTHRVGPFNVIYLFDFLLWILFSPTFSVTGWLELCMCVCRLRHRRRHRHRQCSAKLEIVSYNFMGITAIPLFFSRFAVIFMVSRLVVSCRVLLSSKWIPFAIRNTNKKDENMVCAHQNEWT